MSIKSIAQDAREIMKQLCLPEEKTVAVGHSMGGIVVAELAQLCKLYAVVMVGPVLPKEALGGVFNARVETVSKGEIAATLQVVIRSLTKSQRVWSPWPRSSLQRLPEQRRHPCPRLSSGHYSCHRALRDTSHSVAPSQAPSVLRTKSAEAPYS